MRSSSLPAVLSLALAGAAGCVADPSEEAADLEDAPALAEAQSALCAAIVTAPPAADWTHYFASAPNQIRSIGDYGTTNCANYVVRLINGGSPDYEQGYIRIYTTGELPTTPEACVGTSLTVRRWIPPTSGTAWDVATVTTNAEWTASGCVAPQAYTGSSFWTSGVRYEASSQRAYCPNGGPFCSVQYGLPIKVKVELD